VVAKFLAARSSICGPTPPLPQNQIWSERRQVYLPWQVGEQYQRLSVQAASVTPFVGSILGGFLFNFGNFGKCFLFQIGRCSLMARLSSHSAISRDGNLSMAIMIVSDAHDDRRL
jgi:hypothetical protein